VVALDLLSRADDGFAQRLALVRPDQWAAQTPCTEWDVRALVNHVVGANRRYTMLLHGATTDEAEATRAVDHLGDDPVASFVATAAGRELGVRGLRRMDGPGRGGEGADAGAVAGAAPDQAEPDRRQADDRDQDDVVAAQQLGRGCHVDATVGWTISPQAAGAKASWRLRVT